ncbi:ABC transporter ATP-binding protein, partial [Brevundimonas sp.]|uniref:ATP-binding cassette domain-containing protein n=1 Tax=Brevundimonas sp. TaxID=1871086 RepID=UPI0025DE0E3C
MTDAAQDHDHVPAPGLRDIWRYARQVLGLVWRTCPRLAVQIGLVSLFIAVSPALIAYVGKLLIDSVLAAIGGDLAQRDLALVWVSVETGLLGLSIAARRVQVFQKKVLQAELTYAVTRRIQAKTVRMDLAVIEQPLVQQRIALARQHAASRPFGLVNRVFDGAQYTVTLLTFAAVLWTFSPWAVLLILAGGMPLFVAELRFSHESFRFYTGRTPEMRQRAYLEGLLTSDSAAAERIHSGADVQINARHADMYARLFERDMSLQGRRTVSSSLLILLGSAFFLAGKVWLVWVTVLGGITLGAMTMYIALLKQGQNTVNSLLTIMTGGYEDLLYLSNLDALENEPEGPPRGTATEGPRPGEGYRLENVGYQYPGVSRPALEGVTLDIPPGVQLGVVGVNGSGKTTLVKLLTGLYRPTTGRITLDGLPLEDWEPGTLFARTAVLFQPFQRYQLTAGENIAMGEGLRVSDRDRLEEAARAGLADPVLQELPEGLDAKLSRQQLGGRELSGGQWQRLALARAMLRTGADTLILDEPTAALDSAAEEMLLETTRVEHRTLVLIS